MGHRLSVDPLHDKIRTAPVSGSRIEYRDDAWMLHPGQRLTFLFKSLDHLVGFNRSANDLQGHLAVDGLQLFRSVNDPKSPAPQHIKDLITSDPRSTQSPFIHRPSRPPRAYHFTQTLENLLGNVPRIKAPQAREFTGKPDGICSMNRRECAGETENTHYEIRSFIIEKGCQAGKNNCLFRPWKPRSAAQSGRV